MGALAGLRPEPFSQLLLRFGKRPCAVRQARCGGVDQPSAIDQPEAIGGLGGAESCPLQQAPQPLGDAAAGTARPEDDDLLVGQRLAKAPQAGQDRRGGHAAGALDVVVEARYPVPVGLQHGAGMGGAEVLPVHQRAGADPLHRRDEALEEGGVGLPLQPGLAQAGVAGVREQFGPVGAHIEHHWQPPGRIQPGAEGVDGQLPLADLDAPHPLVAEAEDPLGVGDQEQVRSQAARAATGLRQQLLEPLLLGCRQVDPLAGAAVGVTEVLDRLPHRGGVDDRHRQLDVVGEEAVEEGDVPLPQGLEVGVPLQVAAHGAEGQPAALHLGLDGLHLPGQQGLQTQGPAFRPTEGGALVEQGIVQQLGAPEARAPLATGFGDHGVLLVPLAPPSSTAFPDPKADFRARVAAPRALRSLADAPVSPP